MLVVDKAKERLHRVYLDELQRARLRVAFRAGPKLLARLGQALLVKKGLVIAGRALPVLAAPISAAINSRDIQRAGETALRYYGTMRNLPSRRKTADAH